MKKFLSIFLCLVLVLSCGAFLCSCGDKNNESEETTPFGDEYYNTIGAGRKSFFFVLTDQSGFVQNFQINSDCVYLLAALRENNMILTPEGDAIIEITGILADETNGSAWVLYENDKAVEGNYEEIKITADYKYSFIAETK